MSVDRRVLLKAQVQRRREELTVKTSLELNALAKHVLKQNEKKYQPAPGQAINRPERFAGVKADFWFIDEFRGY